LGLQPGPARAASRRAASKKSGRAGGMLVDRRRCLCKSDVT
jgi:hypothetical protein